jgi:hypothetical protein
MLAISACAVLTNKISISAIPIKPIKMRSGQTEIFIRVLGCGYSHI